MAETIVKDGQTLHSPVLACRPVRFEDYSSEQLAQHRAAEAATGETLDIYPGSEYVPCEDCGIEVALGPRGQAVRDAAREVGLDPHVCCMFDAARRAAEADEMSLGNLGNPFKRKDT
jgi:hypothetical protein